MNAAAARPPIARGRTPGPRRDARVSSFDETAASNPCAPAGLDHRYPRTSRGGSPSRPAATSSERDRARRRCSGAGARRRHGPTCDEFRRSAPSKQGDGSRRACPSEDPGAGGRVDGVRPRGRRAGGGDRSRAADRRGDERNGRPGHGGRPWPATRGLRGAVGMVAANGSAAYADINSGVAVAVMRKRFAPATPRRSRASEGTSSTRSVCDRRSPAHFQPTEDMTHETACDHPRHAIQ